MQNTFEMLDDFTRNCIRMELVSKYGQYDFDLRQYANDYEIAEFVVNGAEDSGMDYSEWGNTAENAAMTMLECYLSNAPYTDETFNEAVSLLIRRGAYDQRRAA